MALDSSEWPERGELIIATVQNVTDYGAYVKLDEYGLTGLLHRSEISSSWIRNIRDFVRESQKVVLKVLRVDTRKRHIDLSLRRVTKRERIEKIKSWKKERKAEALIRSVAEKTGLSVEEIYEKAGRPMQDEYGLYEAFEKALKEGSDVLTRIGIPEEIAKTVIEVGQERIRIPLVKVKGIIELRCAKPNAVEIIKGAFLKAKKVEKDTNAKTRFYVIAAPKYSIEVLAEDYKHAEEAMQKAAQHVIANIVKVGGQGDFKRIK
jgi:translation initiation factor 2 subunit 1